ncbi:hypothetical protein SAMN05443575_1005 [Jatrophihabitans endophyticus]|uniref:Uncharacterized protein n=1 Tax=Jatrophihabitans endophyticus TaxID=1206085 RepID=A0A1M5EU58_9ACTN|nr:hypothetical protein SAMN05443575_1005 [Jatrophihabitans endophyticus]
MRCATLNGVAGNSQRSPLLTVVLVLLVAWLVLAVLGLLIKGLFVLFVVGVVLVVATLGWGAFKAGRNSGRR